MKQTCLSAVLAVIFFSCSSIRSMEVETYNPAAITFPPEIRTVMIVNNAAQQPDGLGHRYIRSRGDDSVMFVPADSAAYDFCLRLGESMAESPVFQDVRICDDTMRKDSVFYDKRPFSKDAVEILCDSYGVDALISLDHFVFLTEVRESEFAGFPPGKSIHVRLSGELRALWPGQKEIYTFPFSDSLNWYRSEDLYFDSPVTPADVKYAMHYLSGVTGGKMHVNFVPYWSTGNRWYYTSMSSEWKRGAVHAAAGKWEEAAAIWEPLLSGTGNWRSKACLLSNLALCREMTGDFEKATGYAAECGRLFETYAGEDSDYTKLQKRYLEVLNERAKNDAVLSGQLRESPASGSAVH
ncbi:MAG: tetratricopeptide repeat protein [Tannerella sp.]|nr:tetratricopeptide repeat protein [Tannerella sp.]